jgi:hypothetical protein
VAIDLLREMATPRPKPSRTPAPPLRPPEPAPSTKATTIPLAPVSFVDETTDLPPPRPPSDVWSTLPTAPPTDARSGTGRLASLESGPRRSRALIALVGAIAVAAVVAVAIALSSTGNTHGTIEVVSLPAGAQVRIDGVLLARPTPLKIESVEPREVHRVVVSRAGFEPWESDVRFENSASRVRLQAVLVPIVGRVTIGSLPSGAEAVVNGIVRGTTPTTLELPPVDDVVIDLRLAGYRVAHRVLAWEGKRSLDITIPLEKAR